MSHEIAIEITNLRKSYGSEDKLNGVFLTILKGEIFCILGPDGSGKTTIIEILTGLRKPTEGKASLLNYDISNNFEMREIKKRIGVLPQEFKTHDNLSVKENIQYWGKMYDKMFELEETLKLFKLEEYANTRYRKLPSYMKRRVGLAIAFVNDPEIILLDEPSLGLDQFSKKDAWEILLDFKKRGKTILITTNQAIEPQIIADRVAIIHKGSIKDIGTPNELIDRYSSGNKIIVRFTNAEQRLVAIQTLQADCPLEIIDDDIVISSEEITLFEVLGKLDKANVRYSDIITQKPTLNDVFITLTGEKLTSNNRTIQLEQ